MIYPRLSKEGVPITHDHQLGVGLMIRASRANRVVWITSSWGFLG